MRFSDGLRRLRRWRHLGWLLAVIGPWLALAVYRSAPALQGLPYLGFFVVVMLATLVGDWRSGALATLVSAGLAGLLLTDATSALLNPALRGAVGLAFFVAVAALVVWVVHLPQRMNRLLRERVAAQTSELARANASLRAEIASRERAQAQVRQAQKMEAIGQLTGGVAHDFNNMLAIVMSSLALARRRLRKGDTDIMRFLDGAHDGAERAADLTRRLLAFSRRQALAPVVVDLNALVLGMADLLHRTLGERIDLRCMVAPDLWPTRVDPGEMENALLNLAVNARDAMPDGGRLSITTMNVTPDADASHADPCGDHVLVTVADNGCGMDEAVIAQAFDPFFTTKEVGQGTGLGLSQVYGFVRQSGGHVRIDSEPGVGSTVRIFLPRAPAASGGTDRPAGGTSPPTSRVRPVTPAASPPPGPARPGNTAAPAADQTPAAQAGELILVVEDEEAVRHTSVLALRELGYAVRDAASGQEALLMLEELHDVSLLFTDVVMPGMSGRQLADLARRRRPALKVLYTTGYARNVVVHDGGVEGGVDLLMKPFSIDALAVRVRQLLDRAGA